MNKAKTKRISANVPIEVAEQIDAAIKALRIKSRSALIEVSCMAFLEDANLHEKVKDLETQLKLTRAEVKRWTKNCQRIREERDAARTELTETHEQLKAALESYNAYKEVGRLAKTRIHDLETELERVKHGNEALQAEYNRIDSEREMWHEKSSEYEGQTLSLQRELDAVKVDLEAATSAAEIQKACYAIVCEDRDTFKADLKNMTSQRDAFEEQLHEETTAYNKCYETSQSRKKQLAHAQTQIKAIEKRGFFARLFNRKPKPPKPAEAKA